MMMAMRGGGGSKVEVGDSRGASGKSGEEPWLVDKASWDSTDDTDAEPRPPPRPPRGGGAGESKSGGAPGADRSWLHENWDSTEDEDEE